MSDPIIPFVDKANLAAQDLALLDRLAGQFGFEHNSFLTYLHRPAIARALVVLMGAIYQDADASLPADLKGKLGIICSTINGCTYCTSHQCHAAAHPPAGTAGLSEEAIAALASGTDTGKDALERACFAYARAASFDPASVSVAILEDLKQVASTPQIVELAVVVGLWKMVNTIHDTLKLPVEAQVQDFTRFLDAAGTFE